MQSECDRGVVVYVVRYWDMIDGLSSHYIHLSDSEKKRGVALKIINMCGTQFGLYYILVNNAHLDDKNPAFVFFSMMNIVNHVSFNDPGIRLIFEELSSKCVMTIDLEEVEEACLELGYTRIER